MKNPALWIVTALYVWQAGACMHNGQYPQSMIVGGYVIANLGLI